MVAAVSVAASDVGTKLHSTPAEYPLRPVVRWKPALVRSWEGSITAAPAPSTVRRGNGDEDACTAVVMAVDEEVKALDGGTGRGAGGSGGGWDVGSGGRGCEDGEAGGCLLVLPAGGRGTKTASSIPTDGIVALRALPVCCSTAPNVKPTGARDTDD